MASTARRRHARRSRVAAYIFTGIFLGSGLTGIVFAGTVNDLLGHVADFVPNNVKEGQAEEVFDEYETLRQEPQVPANMFYDSAGDDLAIGGFGNWTFLMGRNTFAAPTPGRNDWAEIRGQAAIGEWGFSFGNQPNGQYLADNYDAYYVSPRIDLRSISFNTGVPEADAQAPVPTEGVPGEVELDPVDENGTAHAQGGAHVSVAPQQVPVGCVAAGICVSGTPGADLYGNASNIVTLRFRHRFQFADGQDGARLEVYAAQPTPGMGVRPIGIIDPKPQVVQVGDGAAGFAPASGYRPTAAFGDQASFTGKVADWQPVEFDLSPFLGREVWVAFHVRTNVFLPLAPVWFTDPFQERFFSPRADFYGWKIDAVQIEAPAPHTNVKVHSVVTPNYRESADGPVLVPTGTSPSRGDRSIFSAIVENRGSVTERNLPVDFHVERFVAGSDVPETHDCDVNNPGTPPGRVIVPMLRPGGNLVVQATCDPLPFEGEQYRLTVRAASSSGVADGNPNDNQVVLPFEARTVVRLNFVDDLAVVPDLGETDEARTLTFQAVNTGNDDTSIRMQASVSQGGVQVPSSVVRFADVANPPRDVTLAVGETLTETWQFQILMPGEYLVRLVASRIDDGVEVLNRSFLVTADISPGVLFFDDHLGLRTGRIVGTREWQTAALWPVPPPTDPYIWSLEPDDPADGTADRYHTSVLTGERLQLGDLADLQFSEVRVKVRHYWDPLQFIGPTTSDTLQRYEFALTPVETALNPPSNGHPPISNNALPDTGGSGDLQTAPSTRLFPVSLQVLGAYGPERDRHRFYRQGWVEEEYVLKPQDLRQDLTTIPAPLLQAYRMTALATFESWSGLYPRTGGPAQEPFCSANTYIQVSGPGNNPTAYVDAVTQNPLENAPAIGRNCPIWWIDSIEVLAVPPSGDPVTWLATSGRPVDDATRATYVTSGGNVVAGEVGFWTGQGRNRDRYLGMHSLSPVGPTAFLISSYAWGPLIGAQCILRPIDAAGSQSATTTLAAAEQTFDGCASWKRATFTPEAPVAAGNRWAPTGSVSTGAGTWWFGNHSTVAGDDKRYHVSRQQEVLYSPTIQVPAGLADPRLQLRHKWNFAANDAGGIYLQFMRLNATGDPVPDSPLLLLPTQRTPGPTYASIGYVGSCGSSCGDMQVSDAVAVDYPIGPDLRFLDFGRVNALRDGFNPARPDLLAHDLGRRSISEGALIRLAFLAGGLAPGVSPTHTGGWAIGPIIVKGDQRLGNDVEIEWVGINTTYSQSNGLGPATAAGLVVNVTNEGVFTQRGLQFQLDLAHADDPTTVAYSWPFRTGDDFLLPAGRSQTLEFPFVLPSEEANFEAFVRVSILNRIDDNPLNDCRGVIVGQQQSTAGCLPGQTTFPIRTHRDLRATATVTPLAGRVDNPADRVFFPRSALVTLENRGNVPLTDITFDRGVSKVLTSPSGGSQLAPPDRFRWIVFGPIEPGASVPLHAAARLVVENEVVPPNQKEFSLNFGSAGRYAVRFTASLPNDQNPADNVVNIVIDAWDVFYSHTFEDVPGAEERFRFVTGEFQPYGTHADAWTVTDDVSFVDAQGQGRRSYWFGDGAALEHPDHALAYLEMPAVDLTSASRAFLNFRSRFAFEPGFDGGRVEASLDNGATWRTLVPEAKPGLPLGYTGTVASSNPLNPTGDPTATTLAFTGSSVGYVPDSEWMPVEFDLARAIPDFRRPLVIERYLADGFQSAATVTPALPGRNETRTNPGWVNTGGSCSGSQCWFVENLAQQPPARIPGRNGMPYLWSGIDGIRATISLALNHPDVGLVAFGEEKATEISWWEFRGPGAPAMATTIDGATISPILREVDGEWSRYTHQFSATQKRGGAIHFDNSPPSNFHQRGRAIDNVTVAAFRLLPGGGRADVETKDVPIRPDGAWTIGPGLPGARLHSAALPVPSGAIPIVAVGGTAGEGQYNDILTVAGESATAHSQRVTQGGIAGAALNLKLVSGQWYLHIIGGVQNGEPIPNTAMYSLGGTYSAQAPLPEPIGHAAWAQTGIDTYLVGGTTATGLSDRIYRHSVPTFAPEISLRTSRLPSPLSHGAASAGSSSVFVFGGIHADGEATDEIIEYVYGSDSSGNAATVLPGRMPKALHSVAAAAVTGGNPGIYLFGGIGPDGRSDRIYRFNPTTKAIEWEGTLPRSLSGASAVFAGGIVYVIGGETDSGPTHKILRFDTATLQFIPESVPTCVDGCRGLTWRITTTMDSAPQGWRVSPPLTTHDLRQLPVWVFRSEEPSVPGGTLYQLPRNADERFVSPDIDLTKAVGTINLDFRQRGILSAGTRRSVDVQVLDRLTSPPEWGPWTTVWTTTATSAGDGTWTASPTIDLSGFVGQRIRLGFRLTTSHETVAATANRGWFINDIIVQGETMVGGPLRLRFAAGTDGSVHEGGWGIDNVEIVGRAYTADPGNVAIALDEGGLVRESPPGSIAYINGTVRNLSPRFWLGLGLEGEVLLPTGPQRLVVPEGFPHRSETPGRMGPFVLQLPGGRDQGGNLTDRVPFSFEFHVPPTGINQQFTIQLRVIESGTGITLRDENLGDHLATVRVAANNNKLAVEIPQVAMTPADPDVGETSTIALGLYNPSNMPVSLSATPRLRNIRTGVAEPLVPATISIGALLTAEPPVWTWTPPEPGVYALELLTQTTFLSDPPEVSAPVTRHLQYVFVEQDLLYAAEQFSSVDEIPDDVGQAPDRWLRAPGPGDCWPAAERSRAQLWEVATDYALDGRSARSGVSDEDFLAGQAYPAYLDDELRQPTIRLDHLVDKGRLGNPVATNVYLNLWYRTLTESGDGLRIQARLQTPGGAFDTVRQYVTPAPPPANLCAPSTLISGFSNQWLPATFTVTGLAPQERPIQFTYRMLTDGDSNFQGTWIDGITVSSYNAAMSPASQSYNLVDNARKEFHFQVRNLAPVRDTFSIFPWSLATSLPASVATVEVSPSVLSLQPNEVRSITVFVNSSLDRNLAPSGPTTVAILAQSQGDPNRNGAGIINFNQFAPRIWPDLVAEVQVAATSVPQEGQPLSYLATVSNFGLAPSTGTRYDIFACPPSVSLSACFANPRAHRLQDGELDAIQPFATTGQVQQSRVIIPGTWTPPSGVHGLYRLVVRADPTNRVTDYDLANNVGILPVQVHKNLLPDVAISSLVLTDAAGTEVREVYEGQVVTIRATATNLGDREAPNVKLGISNQFTLRDTQAPILHPGDSVTLVANWIASPGTAIIKAQATTTNPETDITNNVQVRKLVVRSQAVSFEALATDLEGEPGESWTVPLRLLNTGDSGLRVHLRALAPPGIRAEIVPPEIELDILDLAAPSLEVSADAVPPGTYLILAEATIEGAFSDPITVPVELQVVGRPSLVAGSGGAATVTGASETLTVPVANHGTGAARFLVAAEGPAGWSVFARPAAFDLGPGQQKEIAIEVDVPAGYQAGDYVILVRFDGPNAPEPAILDVNVPAVARFEVTTLRSTGSPGAREIVVRVQNVGNVRGVPDLVMLAAESGTHVRVEPPLAALEPGGSSLHTVRLTSANAVAPDADMVVLAGQGLGAPASAQNVPTRGPERIDLRTTQMAVLPRRNIEPGDRVTIEATVQNAGTIPVPDVPVALFVDAKLVAFQTLTLEPGLSQKATFTWTAADGLFAVLVAADPFDVIPEPDRENNLQMETLHVSGETVDRGMLPGFDAWLVLVVLVAAIAARRRNR